MTLSNGQWNFAGATGSEAPAATVEETEKAINQICQNRGGVYAQYSCQYVSWDDVSRTDIGGSFGLSSNGKNISDTRLFMKSEVPNEGVNFYNTKPYETKKPLFTVRPSNWNEKLGRVSASDLAVVVGNHVPPPFGTPPPSLSHLRPITLRDFLRNIGQYGIYAGIPLEKNLLMESLDHDISIRFQTTFLPTQTSKPLPFGGVEEPKVEFATEVYNYQTMDILDPKNLILLCTTQGTAIQQDGIKSTQLFHHTATNSLNQTTSKCQINRWWLEAEQTRHEVGGPQDGETAAEKVEAARRGKATASVIGPQALGQRFNVLMTIQVPLEQQLQQIQRPLGGSFNPPTGMFGQSAATGNNSYTSSGTAFAIPSTGMFGRSPVTGNTSNGSGVTCFGASGGGGRPGYSKAFSAGSSMTHKTHTPGFGRPPSTSMFGGPSPTQGLHFHNTGISNAARVSCGSLFDATWPGLMTGNSLKRDPRQRITVTVVLYHVVAGGAPSESDVIAAIDDLEQLYAACHGQDRSNMSLFNDGGNGLSSKNPFGLSAFSSTNTSGGDPVSNSDLFPEPVPPVSSFGQKMYTLPMSDVPQTIKEKTTSLPVSKESVYYLCSMGNSLLNNPNAFLSDLYYAFCYFRLGNDMNVRIEGIEEKTCLYNMACVCSRMSRKPALGLHASEVPKWCMSEAVRTKALSWLLSAVGAGWSDVEHTKRDSDLLQVRIHHTAAFNAIITLMDNANKSF